MDPPRPLASLRPDVPRELIRVIERCLEKAPADRMASVAELALALQPFAPPDSRDLATRISRIASASKGSTGRELIRPGEPTIAAGTAVNWSESGQSSVVAAGGKSVVVLVAVVVGALLVGVVLIVRAWRAPPIVGRTEPAAIVSPGPSLTPPTVSVQLAAPPVPAIATAVPSASAAPSATSSAPAKRPPRDRSPTAPATPSADEPPRYRTNW
jgi:hypothetical protein